MLATNTLAYFNMVLGIVVLIFKALPNWVTHLTKHIGWERQIVINTLASWWCFQLLQ